MTHLDEDAKTKVYSVSEVFYYYDSLTNIEKIESIDYLIDEAGTVMSTKENSLILYAYDYVKNYIRFRNGAIAYYNIRAEKEAYQHQETKDYLVTRPRWRWILWK